MSVDLHAKSLELADAFIRATFETFADHAIHLAGEDAWKETMGRIDIELRSLADAEDGELWTSCLSALILSWAAELVKTVNEKVKAEYEKVEAE